MGMATATSRLGRHLALAGSLGWPAAAVAGLGGVLLASTLEVEGAWMVLLVAASAATGGLVVAALPQDQPWTPNEGAKPATWLESATTRDQAAHVLLRAALVLLGFFAGLQLALQMGLGRA